MVNGSFVDWAGEPCNAAHAYSYTTSLPAGPLELVLGPVYDGDLGGQVAGWYGGNSGLLAYTITYLGQ